MLPLLFAATLYVGVEHTLPDAPEYQYYNTANHRIGTLAGPHAQGPCKLSEERRIINAPQGRLGASLYYASTERRATVVLVHGADAETREMGFIIPYFVCNGVNVMSYDQRGTGESSGNWLFTSPMQKADDIAAVYDAFRSDRHVDSQDIGVWGFSNGGWVAPLAVLRRPFAFMLLKSAPTESLLSNIDYEVTTEMQGSGRSSTETAQALALWHTVEAALYGKTSWAQAGRVLSADEQQPWFQYSLMLKLPNRPPAAMADGLRRYITYDPYATLTHTTTPTLAMYGALDKKVDSRDSYMHMRAYLRSAGNRDVTVVMFQRAGHTLVITKNGFDPEPPQRYADGYPDMMLGWLRQRGFIARVLDNRFLHLLCYAEVRS